MSALRDRRPLALQVRDQILALLAAERLGPGDQLPSEPELAERFEVGRTTIREALKLLEQDGLIDVRRGLGRFVAHASVERPITRLESVTEMMASLGYVVTNRILAVVEAPADEAESAALGVPAGTPVVRLERLRLQDDKPLIYSVDVMVRSVLPEALDALDWSGSLQAILAARGVAMASAMAQFTAVTLPVAVAQRIGDDPARPWLLLVQVNLTRDGIPVIYSHDYHRGDAFTFNVLRRAES